MMPFLLAKTANLDDKLPLYVCCVGSHEQRHLIRSNGYPSPQLFLTRGGCGEFRIDGNRTLVMTSGTALLLPAGVPHEYYPDGGMGEPWDLGFVAFDGSAARSLLEPLERMTLTKLQATDFDRLWSQLEALWQLINQNGESAYWECSKRMYALLLSLMEDQSAAGGPDGKVYPAGQRNAALRAAVKMIHDHYNERLLLSNVARAAGYSVQHFHRLFVDSFGLTPQQYMMKLRMRRSVQLFEDYPGITVEKVAQQVGMETSYFIRMFKRTYGATPKQYGKEEKRG